MERGEAAERGEEEREKRERERQGGGGRREREAAGLGVIRGERTQGAGEGGGEGWGLPGLVGRGWSWLLAELSKEISCTGGGGGRGGIESFWA